MSMEIQTTETYYYKMQYVLLENIEYVHFKFIP